MTATDTHRDVQVSAKQVERERQEVLARLAEAGGKLTAEEDILFQGQKFIIPERMEVDDAIKFLIDKRNEDEEEMAFSQSYNYRPWDGAHATDRALHKAFGMTRSKATYSMFGKNPPQLISIEIGPDETIQVPWGTLEIPIMPGMTFELGGTRDPELGLLFQITATGPRKWRHHVQGVFALIKAELETNSIYRGKAFDGKEKPSFLDLGGVDPAKVIYSDEVMVQLEANVWSLLRYTEEMRQMEVPLKRAVLLEGPYGTGKTLAAFLTAREAVNRDWTFIYCRPGKDNLAEVMATAQLYQPSVVFFEDVDVVADPASADGADSVSRLLDVFDGIQAKGTEILAVLTTNHVERIHKGMVRPGRLDAVIHIGDLDRSGIERMVKSAVPAALLSENVDYDKVYEAMTGFLPAFCKEAVDRTVRYNLSRNGGKSTLLETDDFVHSALGLRPQLELMEGAKEHQRVDHLGLAMSGLVSDAVSGLVVVRDGETADDPFATITAPQVDITG